jgi:SOS-response transcriptional repressor LexA
MEYDIAEVLKRMMRLVGGSNQAELGVAIGVSQASISDAKRKGKIPPEWLVKMATERGVNPVWVLTGHGQMKIESPSLFNVSAGPDLRRVPVISFVQAGDWTEAIEEFSPSEAEEFVAVTSSVGPRTFGLRVVGNSMEPEFWAGEIVIVDPDREAETGAFVVAKINNDEATFKQLIKDGGSVFLRPLNSAYPIMDVTGRDLRIVGRVVEKVKRY